MDAPTVKMEFLADPRAVKGVKRAADRSIQKSALGGTRTLGLILRRDALYPLSYKRPPYYL